jgi:hypothetical protein
MCRHGDEVILRVPIPAYLSHTGELRWDEKGIDRCIAPIVQALNEAGIYTSSSCCGHGERPGNILLHDYRIILIQDPAQPVDPRNFERRWAATDEA